MSLLVSIWYEKFEFFKIFKLKSSLTIPIIVFENKRLEIVKGLGVVENENLDIIDVKFFFMKDQVKDCVKLNIIFALS
jgi:fumarate reductase subunit C